MTVSLGCLEIRILYIESPSVTRKNGTSKDKLPTSRCNDK